MIKSKNLNVIKQGLHRALKTVNRRLTSAHYIFLLIAVPSILAFSIISPPGWGLDEQVHIARAWQVSRLIPYPQPTSAGFYGGSLPRPLINVLEQGHADSNGVNRAKYFFEREDLDNQGVYDALYSVKITADTPVAIYDFGPTGAYNPLPYIPAAAGLALASLFDMNVGWYIALAKTCNALAYLIVVFAGLRFVRLYKVRWLLLLIAVMPTSLYQASIITADTFSMSITLLFLSIVFSIFISTDKIDKRAGTYLLISSILLAFTKVNYALLASLLLLIPIDRFGVQKSRAWVTRVLLFVGVGLLALILTVLSLKFVSATGYGGDVSSVGQLKWVLFHPVDVIFVLLRTMVVFGQGWLGSIVGLFGYNTVAVPSILAVLYFTIMYLAALYSEPVAKAKAWLVLGIGLVVSASIIGVLYLSFTPIGKETVDGIQGRYFIPCVPLLVYGLAKVLPFDVRILGTKVNESVVFGGSAALLALIAVSIYSMAMYSF